MKKIVSVALVVCLLSALCALCLTGCGLFKSISLDDTKTNLEEADYEVTVLTGEQYVESEGAYPTIMAHELENYLYAVKGEDEIHIFFFASTDYASDNYGFMTSEKKLSSAQLNNVVYFATKQAKADAKI